MNRFIQTRYDNKLPDNYYDYTDYPPLPLSVALEPLLSKINQLYHRIKFSEWYCCHHLDYGLTNDESAALYLYTENCGEQSIYHQLNRALTSENSSMVEAWFGFLKLFHTALEKLPTVKTTIWRGMHIDIAKNLRENQDIIWCGVSSCSLSIHRIKIHLGESSILCSIAAINGKSIRDYTRNISENEVILLPGTRLRVNKNSFDSVYGQHVIHLVEMTDNDSGKSTSIRSSKSSSDKSSKNTSDADQSKKSIDFAVTSFNNGDQYEIIYPKNGKHRYTIFHGINGEKHEGCFADIRANGQGVRTCSNGDRYEGTFSNGKMSGYGTYSRGDEYKYVGYWIDDEATGQGTSTFSNGNSYEGDHEKGKIQGRGIFSSHNGDKYEGSLTDGKAHGRGVRTWADGDRYDGDFKDDKKHGFGTYYYKNGGKYTGNWVHDEMNGEGTLVWPSKTRYKGEFKNGKRHGWGKLIFHNGQEQNGLWDHDKFKD